jgi:serine/threonine-protein kinase
MDALLQLNTALADRYAIERELGRGGMATVYLARDIKHDRYVALKVLDPEIGVVLGSERFLSEIRVTANLQHPNLLPLFDSGEAGGLLYYVMPYVDGESLRDALDRERQFPVDESIRIAIAIASALDYAHKRGVIHRDLKPENILLQSRQPMVADFGIALAVSRAGGARITQTGLSLGTPQYMSPEQATGDRVIDGRTDIYSLGAVLYEMLTGDPPHLGNTAQAIIAKVLTERPPRVRLARDTVPEYVEAAIERSLAKLPADRFATAHDFAEALSGRGEIIAKRSGSALPASNAARARRERFRSAIPWMAALAIAVGLGLWGTFRPREVLRSPTRFVVNLPKEDRVTQGIALSPDGSMFAYAGDKLVIRSMSELEGHAMPGTGNASGPFFSPDGKWIGFIAFGKLKKVSVSGGAPIVLVDSLPSITGAAWGPGDVLAFTGAAHGIMTIPVSGGLPRTLTKIRPGEASHNFPEFLPDGKGIVFTIWHGALENAEIAVATLDGAITRLGLNGVGPHYVGGNLVFAHADGSLATAPFDPTRRLAGPEHPVGQSILVGSMGTTDYAVSANGTLVYAPRSIQPNQAVLVDRFGVQRPLQMDPRPYQRPRYSADGRQVAFDTRVNVDGDIWVYDLASETLQRLTAGEDVHQPEWQPGGKGLAYTARVDTTGEDLMIVPVDGSAEPQPVFRARGDQYDASWTPDGQALVFLDDDPTQAIWMVRLADRKRVKWLGGGGASMLGPRVSPEGRWLAYSSNQSARDEVYVRSFPVPAGVVQISSGGGSEPVWSHDGHSLYYRQDDKLMEAVLVTTPELRVASRRMLLTQRFVTDGAHTHYDVSPDGKSFVFLKNNDALTQLVVVLNWDAENQRQASKP